MGQQGAVVWLTGFSGAGKSTVAVGVDSWLQDRGRRCFLMDGDNVRHGLCRDLGFSEEDRSENIRRAGEAACLLAEAGVVTVCAFISPFQKERVAIREACAAADIPFLEVFVDAPLTVCEKRDPKGLYQKARSGEIAMFTGIDSPYEPPTNPELHLRTDQSSVGDCVVELGKEIVTRTSL
jgi:adenylyl-sulfate kinase